VPLLRVTFVTQPPRWLRPAVDYGPLAAFFLTYLLYGLMAATAVVVVASLLALGAAFAIERRVPLIPLVTAAVVAVFGGLTLWLQDETFIKMKPTIVQALFAAILLGGLALRRPLLKPLFGGMMPPMSDPAWSQLTFRYALFFIAMALLNEAVWRTQSTDFWVTFKVFGLPVLTILFIVSQMPFLNRHAGQATPVDPEPETTAPSAARVRARRPGP
jgi:intracellular septation protein